MNHRKLAAVGVLGVTLAAAAGPAAADENTGFYLGGSVGYSTIEVADQLEYDDVAERFKLDDEDFGWKAFVGYQFLPWLAVEGGYVDFGDVDEQGTAIGAALALDGWDAFLVGNLPIWVIDVFAKVGVVAWDADADFTVGDQAFSASDDGEDLAYGIGAAFDLQHFAIRAEVERFEVDGIDDLYLFSVGATIQF